MTLQEFDDLLVEYEDAAYDCGYWRQTHLVNRNYTKLYAKCEAKRNELLEAYALQARALNNQTKKGD